MICQVDCQSVLPGSDALNVEAGRTSPRCLDFTEVARVNGGVCVGLGDQLGGVQAAVSEGGAWETDRLQTVHRDNVDGELGPSSAIDLTMYGTTPTARGAVRLPAVSVVR